MSPLVSIVIPCFNAEAYVAAAVDSALGQAGARTEVIAVNDGSSDGSLAILGRLASPRLRVLDQPNQGASAARNAGLRLAQGDYIQFLDADDLLAPDKVARQLERLAGVGSRIVASARWARFTASPGESAPSPSALFADLDPVGYVATNIREGLMMHPAAWLVPAEVARAAGPWNERLSLNDDGEYFARVVLASAGVAFVPRALTYYRTGVARSLSGRRDRRALESLFESCVLIAAHLAAAEESPRTRRAAADYFQRVAYEFYPAAPDLYRQAAARARALGGSAVPPLMGARQARLARLVGWKAARRIAGLFRR
jgi:glycosyltransferase involved in cell wall biosynthesis